MPAPAPPILLIDDVPADEARTRAVLESGGYAVVAESDGDAVLRLVRAQLTQGVVSELRIVCSEGPCVVRVLKADRHRLPRLPVVVYTRHGSEEDIAWAIDSGCDTVLRKPADAVVLLREVRRVAALDQDDAP